MSPGRPDPGKILIQPVELQAQIDNWGTRLCARRRSQKRDECRWVGRIFTVLHGACYHAVIDLQDKSICSFMLCSFKPSSIWLVHANQGRLNCGLQAKVWPAVVSSRNEENYSVDCCIDTVAFPTPGYECCLLYFIIWVTLCPDPPSW